MDFKLNIHCDNDAFDGRMCRHAEVARILREIANKLEDLEDFSHYRTLFDISGNDVGRAAFKETN